MNETMPVNLDARPEVAAFVAEVRARLADLPPEERQELTDGLEADLCDLVAEAGPEALGDPDAYTRELRAAAGLDPVTVRVAGHGRPLGERVARLLDASHARWDRAVGGLPGRPWEFVQTLRPLWWVTRAWVAVELLDLWFGGAPYAYVPRVGSLGLVLTVLAVVASVQVGRGRLWPGTRVRSSARWLTRPTERPPLRSASSSSMTSSRVSASSMPKPSSTNNVDNSVPPISLLTRSASPRASARLT